ncbi:DUF2004 domain-containing protein [Gemella sp. GH3]|nr:DUF2004 domain-containing protein [Gemella sp. GH3.1]NYS51575.1 DUF2004 domain-containing protein [Gemella sp. GH3]
MKKINHKFFGELNLEKGLNDYDLDDTIILWEKYVNEINTTLWYDKNFPITLDFLDDLNNFLNNFDEYDEKARKELEKYLSEDNEYIVFHREEIGLDLPEDIGKFVECMKITSIGFWIAGENVIIVDYMISQENSDEILSVKFDNNFEIVDIVWES